MNLHRRKGEGQSPGRTLNKKSLLEQVGVMAPPNKLQQIKLAAAASWQEVAGELQPETEQVEVHKAVS
jgi:hypothetical protein